MRFRLHGQALHVHRCPDHPSGCEFFTDHALTWMLGNREAAKDQLMAFRVSVVARITVLSATLASIEACLARLDLIHI